MSGIGYAISAGIGFGFFQAVNRRANQEMDAYRATFSLLMVGTVSLAIWTAATQDLSVVTEAPPAPFLFFAAAGVIHFFLGWTFLALSQQRVGAAATGAVLGSTPLVGSVLAALVLGEGLSALALVGILLVGVGVVLLALRQSGGSFARRVPWFALAAALAWGSSPLFIRWGLEDLDSPLIGVTVGLLAATIFYGVALGVSRRRRAAGRIPRTAIGWVMAAGVLVALSIAFQWTAFDLISIAVAITLMQIAAPTVIAVAPILVGTELERPTPALLVGAGAVISGSVIVVLGGA